MIKKWLLLAQVFLYWQASCQEHTAPIANNSYESFIQQLESDRLDKKAAAAYAFAYLDKAKHEKNWPQVANAYKCLLHQSVKETRILYADSMVLAAKLTQDDALIGSAYLTKGIVYYDLKKQQEALNNYIIADDYIARTDDDYLKYKVKFNIAQIKYYLGFYHEALSLLRECAAYYKGEDVMPYLSSLHSLGLCYNRLGQYRLCTETNNTGIRTAGQSGYSQVQYRFIHSEGVNQYFTKNYNAAIGKLFQALPAITKAGDFANEAVANFYIGKSYWALEQPEKAIPFFLEVDSAFTKQGYIRPDLRENYEILIGYYKSKNDIKNQLLYINHLLKADKVLESEYKYLSGKIHKEYDTKKLQLAKSQIEESYRSSKLNYGFIILLLSLLLMAIIVMYVENKRNNKKRFEELMARHETRRTESKMPGSILVINPEIVSSVLKHLEKFERANKFLEPDMTLTRLAGLFNSNSKYVSMIITHYKEQKPNDYINGLRIDYIISRLKIENRLRNYTQKALAEECGFSTAQHFTRAFTGKTGISPTYFIAELRDYPSGE